MAVKPQLPQHVLINAMEPPVSYIRKCQTQVIAYEILGNCRELPHAPTPVETHVIHFSSQKNI